MPAISLVVCVQNEHDLFDRLLRKTAGCYDELLVVHDGTQDADQWRKIEVLTLEYGGRFFSRPQAFQQEPHWPFAWEQTRNDWILRLDADEFPSKEMTAWLARFRAGPEPPRNISGYTCIWPLWDGRHTISQKLPAGRSFLFHRRRVRFFGMVEQVPVPDGNYQALDLVLHHQPRRKSYGLHNLLIRKQAYIWRARIAQSLLAKPTDLHCWRWTSELWPPEWEEIRAQPVRTFFSRLILGTLRTLRDQWRIERRFYPFAAIHGPIHHALICVAYCKARRLRKSIAAQDCDKLA